MGPQPDRPRAPAALRGALLLAAVAAVAWLAAGLHSARLEARGSEIAGRLAETHDPADIDRAGRLFAQSRRWNPDTRPILLEAGLQLFADARRRRAARLAELVIAREPDNAAAWQILARAFERTDPARSRQARRRLRELSPLSG